MPMKCIAQMPPPSISAPGSIQATPRSLREEISNAQYDAKIAIATENVTIAGS